MKRIFLVFTLFALALIGVFFVLPNAVTLLGFSGDTFFGGEVWRILSYPLAHVSAMHLLENLVALFVVALLSYELELDILLFLGVFLVSGIVVALLGGLLFPYLLIVGSSLGIYSLFGALSFKRQEAVPRYLLLFVFGMIIFLNIGYTIYLGEELAQPAYHAAGFVAGAVFFGLSSIRRKKRILQNE